MSKNTTRKGLAFGAGFALIASGLAGVPANAAGLENKTFVSLTPALGTEYTVLSDQYIDLIANGASTISGVNNRNVKFLVTDPLKKIRADSATTTKTNAVATTANTSITSSTTTVTGDTLTWVGTGAGTSGGVFVAGAATGTDANIVNGAKFTQATDATNATGTSIVNDGANAGLTLTDQPYLENIVGLSSRAVLATLPQTNIGNALEQSSIASTYGQSSTALTNNRFTDGSFVIDSEANASSSARALRLVTTDAASTYSVTVEAWVDDNDDNVIDATEYASPVRTVTFQKAADLAVSTVLTPIVGDDRLTATISMTPTLNGQQVIAQDDSFLNVAFTRQDNALDLYANDSNGTGTQTAAWNDTSKTWALVVLTDADLGSAGSSTVDGDSDVGWASLAAAINSDGVASVAYNATSGVLTIGKTGHLLRTGDKVTFANTDSADIEDEQFTVASVPSVDLFTISIATMTDTTFAAIANFDYAPTTYATNLSVVDRVFAGTHSAQAFIKTASATWSAIGAKSSQGTVAVASTQATLSTTGSASVLSISADDDTANLASIKTGTTSVSMTLAALNVDNVAVSAGRPVVISTTTLKTNAAAAVGTFKINGLSSPVTLYTDAAGQVSFVVTEVAGLASAQVRIQAVVEGSVTVGTDLDWAAQAYTLVDYGTTAGTIGTGVAIARTTTSTGTYTLDLAVTDQWFQAAPASTYRVVVTGSGVTEKIHTLSTAGRAAVVVTDSGITAVGGTFTSTVALQKLTGSVWADTSSHTVTTTVAAAPSVVLGADGSNLYKPATSILSADLSDAVAAKAIVEIDTRSETTSTPAYVNDVVVQGVIRSATTSVASTNAYVTISGPSNILFSNGSVSARGSLTFLSDGSTGVFEVKMYSTTSQTDSVITVTSMGTSTTTKVSFTGIGVGEGTSLVVTMPAAVKPASTFQVKAKLSDAYGNGVNAGATAIKVTYTGAGIVFGTLPTTTDANGELMFSVLLGSNDTGAVSVTVQYNQNGDSDFTDAKDLTSVGTTAITATGMVASETKVNVGTFKGFVALYAKGYEGQKMSAIVAGKWIVVASLASDFERVVRYTGAGYTITTKIYIDGVQVGDAFTTVTK